MDALGLFAMATARTATTGLPDHSKTRDKTTASVVIQPFHERLAVRPSRRWRFGCACAGAVPEGVLPRVPAAAFRNAPIPGS